MPGVLSKAQRLQHAGHPAKPTLVTLKFLLLKMWRSIAAQMHDELILEVRRECVPRVAALVKRTMESAWKVGHKRR